MAWPQVESCLVERLRLESSPETALGFSLLLPHVPHEPRDVRPALLCIFELWFPDKENGDGMLGPLLREWRKRRSVESLAQYQARELMDRIPIVTLRFVLGVLESGFGRTVGMYVI